MHFVSKFIYFYVTSDLFLLKVMVSVRNILCNCHVLHIYLYLRFCKKKKKACQAAKDYELIVLKIYATAIPL